MEQESEYVTKNETAQVPYRAQKAPGLCWLLAGSVAIGASATHECNPLPSVYSLHDETCTPATPTVIIGCFVPDDIMQWLQKLKPMPKNVAVAHDSTSGRECFRQFDVQFYGLSHLQFDR